MKHKYGTRIVTAETELYTLLLFEIAGRYEGWNFNSGNYLFRTDTK